MLDTALKCLAAETNAFSIRRAFATATNYEQALHCLSNVLTFFQSHSSFTAENYSAPDPRIDRLVVKMLALSSEQLKQMWTYLGSKYMPSVAYRVRMVVLQDIEPQSIGRPILSIDTALNGL